MGTREERDGVRAAIRALLEKDREAGALKPVEAYRALFPGFAGIVDEAHAAAARETPHDGHTRTSGPPSSETRVGEATPPPPPGRAEERIGPYRIVRELGRGGMGVVYEAQDSRLPRRVALKVLSPHFASSSHLRLRFEREASLASRLDHPHICTVHEAGEDDGVPYIAMRFVEGSTLAELIGISREARPAGARTTGAVRLPGGSEVASPPGRGVGPGESPRPGIERVLHLVEKAARALHAAHEKGLIHRDIKPHNIMVTGAGEPVLLDFGLAREEDGEGHQLTQTGSLMGTPAYMSPEQLVAQRIRLDRRTDVYSLGVTLYECLTLRLPFEAPTTDKLYQRILATEPEDPRRLNPSLPEDLRVVLLTALEKDRDRRYQTALDLAEELRRVRENEPILARPVGWPGRLLRWTKRSPALAGVTGSLFLALAVGLGVSLHQRNLAMDYGQRSWTWYRTAQKALGEAQERMAEREAALAASRRSLRTARASGLAHASAVAAATDPMRALLLALEAARLDPRPDVVLRLHEALAESPERLRIALPERTVRRAALLPDGSGILAATLDGEIVLWGADGREVRRLGRGVGPRGPRTEELELFSGIQTDAGFEASPDGGEFLCWTDARAEIWDAGGRTRTSLAATAGERILHAGFGAGEPRLLMATADGAPPTLRGLDGGVRARLGPSLGPLAYGQVVPGTGGAVIVGGRGAVLWDPAGNRLASRAWEDDRLRFVRMSSRGAVLLSRETNESRTEGEALWLPDGAERTPPPNMSYGEKFTPDGACLLYEAWFEGLHVLELADGRVRALKRGWRGIGGFLPGGEGAVVEWADGAVALVTLEGAKVREYGGTTAPVSSIGVTADGRHVWARQIDDRLLLWEAGGRKVMDTLGGQEAAPVSVSGDSLRVLFARHDRLSILAIAEAEFGLLDARRVGRRGQSVGAFHPDGRGIVTTDGVGNGILWTPEGEPAGLLEAPAEGLVEIRDHPPGFTAGGGIVLDHVDGKVRIWTPEGSLAATLGIEGSPVDFVRVSPRDPGILAVHDDGVVRLWGRDGSAVATLEDGGKRCRDAWLSPDGTRILTIADDGTAAIRGLDGVEAWSVRHEDAYMRGGAWSPRGDRILTFGTGSVRLWTAEGAAAAVLPVPGETYWTAAFSPEGDAVLTTSDDRTTTLWDLEGRVLASFPGKPASFGPRGDRVLTVDVQAHLWDRSGSLLASFPRRADGIGSAVLSPDGRRVLTLESDRGFLWTTDTAELLELAEARTLREFTAEERRKYGELLGGEAEGE